VLRTNPDVVARRMHEEVVLVHLRTNRIYTLNSTAARFWELLESGMERDALKRALEEEFEVDGVDLDQEIEDVLAQLSVQGLVVLDGDA
jgi:Coenzyme PQQ synthesis protein D (PqqD)